MKKSLNLLIAFFIIGCSSLPKHRKSDLLVQADRYLRSAQQVERQLKREQALYLYDQAYSTYSRIDHLKGKIHAGIGIARQFHYLGQDEDYRAWTAKLSLFISTEKPEYKTVLDLLFIEIAFSSEEYGRVLDLAENLRTDDLEWSTEKLCYILFSRIKLDQDYSLEKGQIQENAESLSGLYRKGRLRDPANYSYALYALGYVVRFENDLRSAISYFERAREIDTEIENTVGLADDLYSLGRCYEGINDSLRAKSSFTRAYELYLLIGEKDTASKLAEMIRD